MMFGLFLLLFAVSRCVVSGDSSVIGPSERIQAVSGGDVILPCPLNLSISPDFPTVEWSKDGPQPNIVFLYRDGCETFEMKNPAFAFRTSLFMKELKNGNGSLRISSVKLSDAGTYTCKVIYEAYDFRKTLELSVCSGVPLEPEARLVAAADGAAAVQCEVKCCSLRCDMQILDQQGNDVTAQIPTRVPDPDPDPDPDPSSCHTLRSSVTLQDQTHRMTCRVHHQDVNQTRDTNITIPDACMTSSCMLTAVGAVGGTAVVLLLVFGSAFWLWKKKCSGSERQQKTSSHQSVNDFVLSAECETLLDTNRPDDNGKEVAELQLELNKKEEIIQKLRAELQRRDEESPKPVVLQHGRPTVDDSSDHAVRFSASSNSVHVCDQAGSHAHNPEHSPDVLYPVTLTSKKDLKSSKSPQDPNPTASASDNHQKPVRKKQKKAPKNGTLKQHGNLTPDPVTPDRPSTRVAHNQSSPAILMSSGSSCSGNQQNPRLQRSMSESGTRPQVTTRQRLDFSLTLKRNRYSPLSEEDA